MTELRHSVDSITSDALDQLYNDLHRVQLAACRTAETLRHAEARVSELEAEREKSDAITAQIDAKTEQQLNDATEVVQYYKALAERTQAWGEQESARAKRYRARIDAVKAVLAPYDWPHAQVRAAAVRTALAPQQQPTTTEA